LPAAVASAQIILCRNVLIYLSPDHARAYLDRVAESFPRHTTLFLGAAETIWQISDRLEAIPIRDTFIYRRRSAPDRAAAATADEPLVDRRVAAKPRRQVVSVARLDDSGRRWPAATRPWSPADSSPRDPEAANMEPTSDGHLEAAELLGITAQSALEAGDYEAAIVGFRKCVYLAPNDPVAHLHLGLALEAAGQRPSARRAYTAARGVLLDDAGPAHAGIEGFAPGELVRLLDSKLKVPL
jgi:chemotaxis protein methyltransferase CheR